MGYHTYGMIGEILYTWYPLVTNIAMKQQPHSFNDLRIQNGTVMFHSYVSLLECICYYIPLYHYLLLVNSCELPIFVCKNPLYIVIINGFV